MTSFQFYFVPTVFSADLPEGYFNGETETLLTRISSPSTLKLLCSRASLKNVNEWKSTSLIIPSNIDVQYLHEVSAHYRDSHTISTDQQE